MHVVNTLTTVLITDACVMHRAARHSMTGLCQQSHTLVGLTCLVGKLGGRLLQSFHKFGGWVGRGEGDAYFAFTFWSRSFCSSLEMRSAICCIWNAMAGEPSPGSLLSRSVMFSTSAARPEFCLSDLGPVWLWCIMA